MFLKFIQNFYSKVFIAINLDLDLCCVQIIRIKNHKIKQKIKTETKLIDHTISMETLKLIDYYQKRYPFTYIGMISKTLEQGAIPTTNPQEFIDYGINVQQVQFMSFQNTWSTYIQKKECQRLIKQIAPDTPLDCLFSPFLPIFAQANQKENITLYAIQEKSALFLAVCDKHRIYYGKTFFLQDKDSSQSLDRQESLSSLDRLLDTLEKGIEDEHIPNLISNDEQDTLEEKQKLENLNDFMRAISVTNTLENVIQEYYAKHQSSFIDEIIILDTYGISPDSINYINETLMIPITIQPFSLVDAITELMIKEYKKGTL